MDENTMIAGLGANRGGKDHQTSLRLFTLPNVPARSLLFNHIFFWNTCGLFNLVSRVFSQFSGQGKKRDPGNESG